MSNTRNGCKFIYLGKITKTTNKVSAISPKAQNTEITKNEKKRNEKRIFQVKIKLNISSEGSIWEMTTTIKDLFLEGRIRSINTADNRSAIRSNIKSLEIQIREAKKLIN